MSRTTTRIRVIGREGKAKVCLQGFGFAFRYTNLNKPYFINFSLTILIMFDPYPFSSNSPPSLCLDEQLASLDEQLPAALYFEPL